MGIVLGSRSKVLVSALVYVKGKVEFEAGGFEVVEFDVGDFEEVEFGFQGFEKVEFEMVELEFQGFEEVEFEIEGFEEVEFKIEGFEKVEFEIESFVQLEYGYKGFEERSPRLLITPATQKLSPEALLNASKTENCFDSPRNAETSIPEHPTYAPPRPLGVFHATTARSFHVAPSPGGPFSHEGNNGRETIKSIR